ncbi:MAG: phosphonate C-P lyase system protein PhnH [Pseudomonadota bacterium]
MSATQEAYVGGFDNPVIDAQAVFGSVMSALARPGTIQPLSSNAHAPSPLNRGTAQIALTLFDADSAIYIDAPLRDETSVAWLKFHTGATITEEKAVAHFAILSGPSAMVGLDSFAQGSQEYPDRSTTLIVQVDGFDGVPRWQLTGPGINGATQMSPLAVPNTTSEVWARNNRLFPRGVDAIFAGPETLAALPRTTRISPLGGS